MGRPGLPNQVRREFWQQIRNGLPIFKAAQAVGVPITTAQGWYRQAGGVNPYPPKPVSGRYLSFEEREEISVGLAAGRSQAAIRSPVGPLPVHDQPRNHPEQHLGEVAQGECWTALPGQFRSVAGRPTGPPPQGVQARWS